MMARHWESAASPVRQHGRRPQPPWGWPSGQVSRAARQGGNRQSKGSRESPPLAAPSLQGSVFPSPQSAGGALGQRRCDSAKETEQRGACSNHVFPGGFSSPVTLPAVFTELLLRIGPCALRCIALVPFKRSVA